MTNASRGVAGGTEGFTHLSEQSKADLLTAHFTPRIDGENWAWMGELYESARRMDLGVVHLRSVISDLAWESRQASCPIPRHEDLGEGERRLLWIYFEGQRLRFDYRFEELFRRANVWSTYYPNDSLILALRAFAASGLRRSEASTLVQAALDAVDADVRTRHVCLHAVWFGDLSESAEFALRISSDMIANGEADANVYYRRARALRRLRRYDQAQEEIDRALQMLSSSSLSIHADYVRERELISAMREMDQQITSLTEKLTGDFSSAIESQVAESHKALEARVGEASRSLSEGLLKIVEILGIFISIVVFIAGAAFSAINAQGFWQMAVATALFLVGSLSFFMLLRLVTRFERHRA